MYMKDIKRRFKKQEINFSESIVCSFEGNFLSIENKLKRSNFWGNEVLDCNLLLGKNGVGKTGILDLLGHNENTLNKLNKKSEFFILYYIEKNIFLYRGTMIGDFKNSIQDSSDLLFKKDKKNKLINIYFEYTEGDIKIIDFNNNYKKNYVYYYRSMVDVPWTEKIKIDKTKERDIEYINKKIKFNDVFEFFNRFSFFQNDKQAIKLEQKMVYARNSKYLGFLYYANLDCIDPSDFLNDFFFQDYALDDLGNYSNLFKRKIEDEKYKRISKKLYFKLRLLEKFFISEIRNDNLENNFNKIESIIKIFTETKKRMNIDPLKFIDYSLKDLQNNHSYKYELSNLYKNELEEEVTLRIHYIEEILKKFLNVKKQTSIEKMIIHLDKIPEDNYITNNSLIFNHNKYGIDFEEDILDDDFMNYFNYKLVNFSDGELMLLNLFSGIYNSIKISGENNLLIVLDEPDNNMHPEWSRNLIYNLIELSKYKKLGKIQIVVATHSPFIATDFPKKNIFVFNTIDNKKNAYTISNPKFGFAANIYDLLSDTMFMKAPIGEFALKKIKAMDDTMDMREIETIIDYIDDKLLKKILKDDKL